MKLAVPIHPILVHFPIAFYFLEFILILFWIAKHEERFLDFARFSFKFAYGMMLIAMVSGFFDAGGLKGIQGKVRLHALGAFSVFALYTLRALFWRFGKVREPSSRSIHLLFTLSGNMLIAITGFFGGLIVYE